MGKNVEGSDTSQILGIIPGVFGARLTESGHLSCDVWLAGQDSNSWSSEYTARVLLALLMHRVCSLKWHIRSLTLFSFTESLTD